MDWPDDVDAARREQARLADRVELDWSVPLPGRVCGVDVSYAKDDGWAVASACVVDTATFEVVDEGQAVGEPRFPYVPGLLSFRELPLVLAALEDLDERPELIVADGHGYAHPARLGLASHLGVVTGIAAVGCAKTPFVGRHDEVGVERGCWVPVVDAGPGDTTEVVGCVLRTQTGVKPVYVSAGHRIDLDSARRVVLALAPRYRLPETTRAADSRSRRLLAHRPMGEDPSPDS